MKHSATFPKLIFITFFVIVNYSFLQSQTKKEVQFSLDTLQKSHKLLQQDFQLLQKEWQKQNQFFEHVKSSFFNISDVNMSIDKAFNHFDTINNAINKQMKNLNESNNVLIDSIQLLNSSITQLSEQNKYYSKLLLSSLNKASFPQTEMEFIGAWNLFLDPVQISGKPFESGLISYNQFLSVNSIKQQNLYKVVFSADEIATIYYTGGKVQKCFYSIINFSPNSPYSILFSKQEEFKLTMQVSPLTSGLMVSYELPLKTEKVLYYYGLMKKQ